MKYRISKPAQLLHTAALPSSKSISNRALIIHTLSGASDDWLQHTSDCDDTFVMQRALRMLREERTVEQETNYRNSHKEKGAGEPPVIDIMAAGTSMRFLTALLSVTDGCHVITGSERMRHRPISVLVDALRRLGADIAYEGEAGFPPLRIRGGQLHGGRLEVAGDISSQYISALLMIAPRMTDGLELHLCGTVVSRPYIHMTVAMMRQYGARVSWRGNRTICVEPSPYSPIPYSVEADWSAAAFWFEMAAVSTDGDIHIRLPRLRADSLQGDAEVRRVFRMLGIQSRFEAASDGGKERVKMETNHKNSHNEKAVPVLHVWRSRQSCPRLDYDFTRIPDLAQAVVVACCMTGVPFRLTGLQTLRIKETDRIAALCTELCKWGVHLTVEDDCTLCWEGPKHQPGGASGYLRPQEGSAIDTYDDHRMAMAFAPAALCLKSVDINHPEVVTKSYPGFWQDLLQAGFQIKEL